MTTYIIERRGWNDRNRPRLAEQYHQDELACNCQIEAEKPSDEGWLFNITRHFIPCDHYTWNTIQVKYLIVNACFLISHPGSMARENATPKLRQQWTKFCCCCWFNAWYGTPRTFTPINADKSAAYPVAQGIFYFDENM